MTKKLSIVAIGFIAGIALGVFLLYFKANPPQHIKAAPRQIIGFLPYWLLNKAKTNYAGDITTLTYFALTVGPDGHIVKLASPQQEEPGWYALNSGKLNPFFANARENNIKLSLAIESGDAQAINKMVDKPVQSANNLIADSLPLMKKYHFQDLNLDIEDYAYASQKEQTNFTQFIKTIKQQLRNKKLGALTIEINPNDAITLNLINIKAIAPYVDNIVVMAYDYHSPSSLVTGAIAPQTGAGIDASYDVTTTIEKTLQLAPSGKVILGVPLYGYEWETLSNAIHSAVIPGTAETASNSRMQSFLSSCATCNVFFDNEAQEAYVTYKDQTSGAYHQIFFPTQQSVQSKIALAKKEQLGGIGLWALGYEGSDMLTPLSRYK